MSDDEMTTGDPCAVSVEDPAGGTAELAAEPDAAGAGSHVIELRGADGWELDHPVQCTESLDCPVTEAAGRISQAMCATLGRWQCDASGGGLVLLERIGD